MANIKISELEEMTETKDNDLLVIVDSVTDTTKKIKGKNAGFGGGTYIGTEQPTKESYNVWINPDEITPVQQREEIYTEEEQVIGTWIDGKKIYRKVIQANITSGSNIIKVNDNIENIVDYTTYVTRTDNGTYIKDSYYVNDASHIIVNYIYSSKSIEVFVAGLAVSEVLILVEYTKTTD